MAVRTWPTSLRALPDVDATIFPPSVAAATPLDDGGTAYHRRISGTPPTRYQIDMTGLTMTQGNALIVFWRDTCNGGVDTFTGFPKPSDTATGGMVTTTDELRIVNLSIQRLSTNYCRATLTLEDG